VIIQINLLKIFFYLAAAIFVFFTASAWAQIISACLMYNLFLSPTPLGLINYFNLSFLSVQYASLEELAQKPTNKYSNL
jgi:hypothetical protein